MSWIAIVPVKGTSSAKSRLNPTGQGTSLALAFALDTVAALREATQVRDVVVVTRDEKLSTEFTALGASVLYEEPGKGDPLNRAIRQGLAAARLRDPAANLAVFTGDLPSLLPRDVDMALARAAAFERSMVPDSVGSGTAALFALAGVSVEPRFGTGSSAAHQGDGHVPLAFPSAAGIRRDVDVADDLRAALRQGVGAHTRALMASTSAAISAVDARSFIQSGTATDRMPAADRRGTDAPSTESTSHASMTPSDRREP
jgi:2-phospho-L-lactate guanylyltransferase